MEKHQRKSKRDWLNTKTLSDDIDPKSLSGTHKDDNGHEFDWSQTKLLGQASTRHAREFKEPWYSIDKSTINRHIDIPTIYPQLK